MIKHEAADFYFASAALAMTRTGIEYAVINKQIAEGQPFDPKTMGPVISGLETVGRALPQNCNLAAMAIDDLLAKIVGPNPVNAGTLTNDLQMIEGRIRDGLRVSLFLSLTPDEAALYEPKASLFGDKFCTQFPSVIYEIDEAAKCLGLERSTASAFHSLRCLEAGIAALSRCLAIPDPTKPHERSWMKLLEKMDGGIKAKWPSNANRMDGDGRFFDEVYAALAAMQNPWRNATMHLDQKYTPDEASHIFNVVKGFMVRVANRMDENGEPKA